MVPLVGSEGRVESCRVYRPWKRVCRTTRHRFSSVSNYRSITYYLQSYQQCVLNITWSGDLTSLEIRRNLKLTNPFFCWWAWRWSITSTERAWGRAQNGTEEISSKTRGACSQHYSKSPYLPSDAIDWQVYIQTVPHVGPESLLGLFLSFGEGSMISCRHVGFVKWDSLLTLPSSSQSLGWLRMISSQLGLDSDTNSIKCLGSEESWPFLS
jgi:hypothetical protein